MKRTTKILNLLIVEDNAGDFLLIEDYLREEIAQPILVQAKPFAEAKTILQNSEKSFDAILLDLSLPDAQGEFLVNEIIKLSGTVPVIVLTGYSEKDFGIKTLALGVSDYLLKDELNSSLLYRSIAYSRERSRINAELNKSEENYRYLFELSPLPMWVMDFDSGYFVKVNQAAIRHYGYSEAEFLNMTLPQIKPVSELDKLTEVRNKLLEHGTFFHGTTKDIKKNGEIIHVSVQTNQVDFNGKKAILIVANDITETLEKEAQILKYNERLQTAQQIGRLGYWEFDIRTEALFWSDEVYAIFGYDKSFFTPTFESYTSLIHPEDLQKFENYQQRVLGISPIAEIEHRILDAKGNIRHIYQKSNLIRDSEGTPIMLEGITQDITETRKYIQAIEEQNTKLREIAWMQSHVVRAPLARILGLINLLNADTPKLESQEILQYIQASAVELDEVIRTIVNKTEKV